MEEEFEELPDPWWRGPLKIIFGMFLLLILVTMSIPYWGIADTAGPSDLPSLLQVRELGLSEDNLTNTVQKRDDYKYMVDGSDREIKRVADYIAQYGCDSSQVCHAKALFYFVRDSFTYVRDPTAYEYVKGARESLLVGGGDCDDASVLLANLLDAVGIPVRFVFVPGHVYVEGYLDKKWKAMDSTCKSCDYGEISYKYADSDKKYVYG